MSRRGVLPGVLLAVAVVLGGCARGPADGGIDASGRLRVAASFYPLAFVAERIGGSAVVVSSLTKPGVEPHDLELAPRDVASVADARAVLYVHGFQAAVDKAVEQEGHGRAFDAHDAARLTLTYTPIEGGQVQADETGVTDPHFWLDPTRLADVGDAFAAHLAKADPARAGTFMANAQALRRDLTALDQEFAGALRSCLNKDLVTSHNAFGYLGERYGLRQIGISGLDPQQEASAGDLAAVSQYVRAHRVRTIYYETLVSPSTARTVADETGATTAVLDPIEGLTPQSAGKDYLEVMRSNLRTLRTGQACD